MTYIFRYTAHSSDGQYLTTWPNTSGLKAETESLIIAAQDQARSTNNHKKNILKQEIDGICRRCGIAEEYIGHIVAGCTMFAPTEYFTRHNMVASYVHWKVCKDLGIQMSGKWDDHQPTAVTRKEHVVVM